MEIEHTLYLGFKRLRGVDNDSISFTHGSATQTVPLKM